MRVSSREQIKLVCFLFMIVMPVLWLMFDGNPIQEYSLVTFVAF